MQTDKFKFLSATARKITVLSEFKSHEIEQLTVSIQESLAKYADRAPIRSEFKNHYLYLVVCKTLPSTHNISHQVKITVK